MEKIKDLDIYTKRMRSSLEDKLFWTHELDLSEIDCIVDFGCADLSLIKKLDELDNDFYFIGYDIDENMLNRAKSYRLNHSINLYSDYQKLIKTLKYLSDEDKNILINFSSVLHEVYTYDRDKLEQIFLDLENIKNIKYITIRDMHYSKDNKYLLPYNKNLFDSIYYSDKIDLYKTYNDINRFDKENFCPTHRWIIEFFLKYRYIENWEKEKNEIYLFDWSTIEKCYKNGKFYNIYDLEYSLPFIRETVEKDFGIAFPYKTHRKLILKRR